MSTTERASFTDLLAERGVLIADGATGTNYQTMGMEPGLAPEEWLFQAPERVVELHRAFVDAGADIVLTCTFGATPLRLNEGPLVGKVREVNLRAAELAREGAGADRLVAGSLGPTGMLIEPYGLLNREDAMAAYAEQASALAEGGVDLLVLETIFAVEEAVWAVEGIQSATNLPLVVSFSFDMGTRTMMGLSPTDAVAAVVPMGIAAVGTNCGRSLADADLVVGEILAAAGDVPVWVKPNAGVPQDRRRQRRLRGGPGDAGRARRRLRRAGRAGRRRLLRVDARARRRDRASTGPLEVDVGRAFVRVACFCMSRRSRPGVSTRTRTSSSTGSSRRASRGGSCCRSTSPTSSAPRTRRARRSPGSRACSSPARLDALRQRRGRRGRAAGRLARGVGAVRRRVGAPRPDALPARVAGAEVVCQRARHPADRRHPALRRGRLVRRDHPSLALRPLGRRGRVAVPESSRGAALGHAGVRLAGARAHAALPGGSRGSSASSSCSTCSGSTTSAAS